jgi:hypothetical protein
MVLEGVGLEDKLNVQQRKKLERKTVSHFMFGFAGAERNCNPWHVRGGMGNAGPWAMPRLIAFTWICLPPGGVRG